MTAETIRDLIGDRLAAEDRFVVEMLCVAWATWKEARKAVDAQGAVVMSGGTAIPNPNLTVADKAQAQFLQLAKELGLSPAARKKLAIDATEDEYAD